MGDSLAVELSALDRATQVRILVPQPIKVFMDFSLFFPLFSAFFITYIFCKIAEGRYLLSFPNHRSSHLTPTSRFGGIAIIIGVGGGVILAHIFEGSAQSAFDTPILMTATLMGVLGAVDDLYDVRARTRLVFQGIFAACLLFFLQDHFSFSPFLTSVFFLLAFIFIVAFINASNFSDGLNGLWSGTVLVWSFYVMSLLDFPIFLQIFCVALLAYFILNFPKGRIFMGDSGSTFLGAVIVGTVLSNIIWAEGQVVESLIKLVVLCSPIAFIFSDIAVTLCKRIVSGHHPFDAHKEHYMQKMVHLLKLSHGQVTCIYMMGAMASTLFLGKFMMEGHRIFGFVGYAGLQILFFISIEMLCRFRRE